MLFRSFNFYPTHEYEDWRLVSYFYEGLTPRDRQFVQLSCGRDFLQKEPEDAMDYLNEIAENSNTWTRPSPMDSTDRTRSNATTSSGSVFKLREDDNMSAKISMLTKEIETLKMKGSKNVSAVFREALMDWRLVSYFYEDWRLVSYFYEGLTPRDQQFVQLSCGGDFLQKEPEDAMNYLDDS